VIKSTIKYLVITLLICFFAGGCIQKRLITLTGAEIVPNSMTATPSMTITATKAVTASMSATPSCTQTSTPVDTITLSPTASPAQSSTPLSTATVTPTVLYRINLSLIHDVSTGDNSTVWFLISQNNTTPYPYATCTVDGILVPYSGDAFTNSNYMLPNAWIYKPGQQAFVTIEINGQTGTYTTAPLPGGITMTADGLNVSWTSPSAPGQFSTISVINSGHTQTYQAGPALVSPQTIPGSAYPAPDTYQVQISMENDVATDYNAPGIIWAGSVLTCYEIARLKVTK